MLGRSKTVRRILIIIALCVGCITAADAQSSFTQKLQQRNSGEGRVTVTHDKHIDELVNGKVSTPVAPPVQKQPTEKKPDTTSSQKEQDNKPVKLTEQDIPATTADTDTIDMHKKVMRGYKINGYRVQVFAGGNSRNDRLKAERTGNEIKSLFPDVPVYVHFYSPRWICRIGNYRTYEEASEVLRSVKQLGYQSAIIVKGKITVQYP